jgi:hypothetical protein
VELGDEVLTRHCPYASRIAWRIGPVGARVTEAYDCTTPISSS